MLVSPSFKSIAKNENGNYVVERSGIVENVIIPENLVDKTTSDINIVGRSIEVSSGDSVYILVADQDAVGLLYGSDKSVEVSVFFVNGGVLIELVEGTIALKGANGDVYTVDELGDIDYPSNTEIINWESPLSLRTKVTTVAKYRYGTTDEYIVDYVDNLLLDVFMHYTPTEKGSVFVTRVVEYYEDLGLGIFAFVNMKEIEAEEDDEHVDISELGNIPTEGEEEEDESYEDDDDEYDEEW